MSNLKKIVINNKGIVAFVLMFIFLATGFAKSVIPAVPSFSKKESLNHHTFKNVLRAGSASSASVNFFDPLKDSDNDDLEFALFGNEPNTYYLEFTSKSQTVTLSDVQHSVYIHQLYDLYCNWKFHLS
jgi:hypothetical protein